MKEIIAKKLDEKVRAYLKKQFPEMTLMKYKKITDRNADVYGFKSMMIKVVAVGNQLRYQLVTNSNK